MVLLRAPRERGGWLVGAWLERERGGEGEAGAVIVVGGPVWLVGDELRFSIAE